MTSILVSITDISEHYSNECPVVHLINRLSIDMSKKGQTVCHRGMRPEEKDD